MSTASSQISDPRPGPQPLAPSTALPRFVVTLDAPATEGSAALLRVPLALTGKWVRGTTEFTITRQDLEEIVRNFRERQSGEINVDYDHASEMPEVAAGGPIPSAGRIVKLDLPEPFNGTGQKILWGWYEPTERARALLRSREYRYLSPAIDWAARSKLTGQPQGTTLTSVALTNRPFLEELPQIRLSDPAYQLVEARPRRPERSALTGETGNSKIEKPPRNSEFPVSSFDFRLSNTGGPMKSVTLSVADGKIKIAHEDFEEEYVVEPAELRRSLEALGLMSEVAGPTARADISLAQARSLLSEAEARGKSVAAVEVFRAQAEQELEEAVKAGKILPRQREDWRKIALADWPTFRRLLAAQKPLVPLQPLGFSGSGPADVQAQVKFLAEQRMRERGISYGQALSEIGREQPDLVQQYRRAVSGREP